MLEGEKFNHGVCSLTYMYISFSAFDAEPSLMENITAGNSQSRRVYDELNECK